MHDGMALGGGWGDGSIHCAERTIYSQSVMRASFFRMLGASACRCLRMGLLSLLCLPPWG